MTFSDKSLEKIKANLGTPIKAKPKAKPKHPVSSAAKDTLGQERNVEPSA